MICPRYGIYSGGGGGIMSSDIILWRFAGIESLSDVSEGNSEILGGDKKEERPLTHHVDIKGAVQGLNQRDVAHVAGSRK